MLNRLLVCVLLYFFLYSIQGFTAAKKPLEINTLKSKKGYKNNKYGIYWIDNKKGFFKEWRTRTSSLSQEKNLPLHEAAEKAYYDLKFQGSE